MRQYAADALVALAPYDLVLTPTLATPPPLVGALRDDADPAADFEAQKRFTPWTSAWNVTGMPAVSLPLHRTADGLPVGVMLAARPAEEHVLLAASAQLEQARPWARPAAPGLVSRPVDNRPPAWSGGPMSELTPYLCVADARAADRLVRRRAGRRGDLRADRDGRRPDRARRAGRRRRRAG